MRVNTLAINGGVSYKLQNRLLKNHLNFVFVKHGRIMDLMHQRKINLKHIHAMVLDEADRMLDMGFMPDIKKIYDATSGKQQMLMFTATLNKEIEKIAQSFLKDPLRVSAESKIEAHKNIKQYLYSVKNYEHKKKVLEEILSDQELNQAIIFTSTKRDADKLSRDLFLTNFISKPLHGDLSQRQRTQIIDRFKDNKLKILVATDIAARGIDVKEVTHVINFDLPRKAEDYIHRIGRTGRADRQGKAYSLVTNNDRPMITKIERYAKVSLELLTMEGKPQEKDFRSEPAKKIFKKKFKSKKKLSSKRNSNKTHTFSHRS
jgi:superfamily II DNA/RNA helicase